uniref:Uncharacterized protein n=1 Tax=Lygus hesperus TaxID=30085 RepID=A0A146LT25_LYGHE
MSDIWSTVDEEEVAQVNLAEFNDEPSDNDDWDVSSNEQNEGAAAKISETDTAAKQTAEVPLNVTVPKQPQTQEPPTTHSGKQKAKNARKLEQEKAMREQLERQHIQEENARRLQRIRELEEVERRKAAEDPDYYEKKKQHEKKMQQTSEESLIGDLFGIPVAAVEKEGTAANDANDEKSFDTLKADDEAEMEAVEQADEEDSV